MTLRATDEDVNAACDAYAGADPRLKSQPVYFNGMRAALADFDRLRRWCNDDWSYVGVIVAPVCPCCDEAKWDDAQSLWGIESDAGEYLQEVARELAGEFVA